MKHVCSIAALGLIAAGAARADVTIYANEPGFIDAAPPIVSRVTFTNIPDLHIQFTVEFDNVQYETRGRWDVPGACSENRNLGAGSGSRRTITFVTADGGAGSVLAFGFRLSTNVLVPPGDYGALVTTADGLETTVLIPHVINGDPAYRGFVSTSPIVSVVVIALSGDNFCFDDVSHSAVQTD